MASAASDCASGHGRSESGSLIWRKLSAYGAPPSSTEAARSLPQCCWSMATGTSRAHRARRARLSHRGLHQDEWGVDALLAQSGDARRIDSDDSRGTWLVGDTPPLGGKLGQAVLVEDRPPWSGAAEAEEQQGWRGRLGGKRSGPAGPARGQRCRLGQATRQRRQSGYVVKRGHSPSWGRQCSSTATRSGAERQRQRNSGGGWAAAPAQRPGGPSPGAAVLAQPGG